MKQETKPFDLSFKLNSSRTVTRAMCHPATFQPQQNLLIPEQSLPHLALKQDYFLNWDVACVARTRYSRVTLCPCTSKSALLDILYPSTPSRPSTLISDNCSKHDILLIRSFFELQNRGRINRYALYLRLVLKEPLPFSRDMRKNNQCISNHS